VNLVRSHRCWWVSTMGRRSAFTVAPKSALPGVGSARATRPPRVAPPRLVRVEPVSSPAAEDVKNERRSMSVVEPEKESGNW
jgi:hypothetical protein